MSGENNPNDDREPAEGGQPQGGQPQGGQPQGGQPQGGQPQGGQPQGGQPPGQPPGGQPQQGQPQQGQPQGGQAYGQPPQQQYQQGPGMLDKLQRPAVQEQIVNTAITHALLGAGVLLTLLILPNLFGSGSLAQGAASVSFGFSAVGFGGGLLLAVLKSSEFGTLQEETNTVAAASFVGNGVGYFVAGLLTAIGVIAGPGSVLGGFGGGPGIVDYLIPVIVAMLFVGAMGAATTFVDRNY